jgi:GTPase SAR1 family protein
MGTDVPLLLLGGAGSGKSSLIAKAADDVVNKAATGGIPGYCRASNVGDRFNLANVASGKKIAKLK